jgi:hypothetical protein
VLFDDKLFTGIREEKMTEKELDMLYDALIKVAKTQAEIFKEFIDRLDHAKVRTKIVEMLKETFNEDNGFTNGSKGP